MAKPHISADRLRELVSYDQETGVFTWISAFCQKIKIGAKAGTVDKRGYIQIRINGHKYLAHRLAILHVTGEWPPSQVDHADLCKSNNRYQNLRLCTPSQNNCNRPTQPGRSGARGVGVTKEGRFETRIAFGGRRYYVGAYSSVEDAEAAYVNAASRLHGEFALDKVSAL